MNVYDWTIKEVGTWTTSQGYDKLIKKCLKTYKIDGFVLMKMDKLDFGEMKDISLGDRLHLWHSIETLRRENEVFLKSQLV